MTIDKDIRDYLHLYLGCDMQYASHHEPQNELYKLDATNFAEAVEYGDLPALRPLGDMTEEEAKYLCEYFGEYGDMPGRRTYEFYRNAYGELIVSWGSSLREKWSPSRSEAWKPEQLKYLLSKHFDLFELIDTGLAIDKTKVK